MKSSQLNKARFIVGIIRRGVSVDEKKRRRLTRCTFLYLSAIACVAFVLVACADTTSAPVHMAAPMEESTEFDVILKAGGENKIEVIKVVRQLTNLSLKEAQDLVESAPASVLKAVSKEAADDAKTKLEAVGATVEVKYSTAPAPALMAAPMEESTEFDVILVASCNNKIEVIKIVRQLTNLSLKEAKDLVESAPAPVLKAVSKEAADDAKTKLEAVGAAVEVKYSTASAPESLAVPMEEKTEFDVILVASCENKIEVIKVVRQLTNLSLKEAKDLVESAPAPVLKAVSKEAADDAKSKLEAAGAAVEVK